MAALDLAIRMVDLTTLEGADTPGKVRAMFGQGRGPTRGPGRPAGGRGLRVPDLVEVAKREVAGQPGGGGLGGHGVPVRAASLAVKLADTRDAVAAGPTR